MIHEMQQEKEKNNSIGIGLDNATQIKISQMLEPMYKIKIKTENHDIISSIDFFYENYGKLLLNNTNIKIFIMSMSVHDAILQLFICEIIKQNNFRKFIVKSCPFMYDFFPIIYNDLYKMRNLSLVSFNELRYNFEIMTMLKSFDVAIKIDFLLYFGNDAQQDILNSCYDKYFYDGTFIHDIKVRHFFFGCCHNTINFCVETILKIFEIHDLQSCKIFADPSILLCRNIFLDKFIHHDKILDFEICVTYDTHQQPLCPVELNNDKLVTLSLNKKIFTKFDICCEYYDDDCVVLKKTIINDCQYKILDLIQKQNMPTASIE